MKERLLEARQTLACVGALPIVFAIGDKIRPLSFQRVRLESRKPTIRKLLSRTCKTTRIKVKGKV